MRRQIRIIHHVVLVVREHVGFTALRDRAQLHSQGITSRTIMLLCVTIATASVVELAAAKYAAIGQIKPEILCEIAFLTLPTTRRNPLAVVQLLQIRGVSKKSDKLYILT